MLETLYRTLKMLPGKHRCGHKNCALFSVKHTFECRTKCHLSLSEAHISAEESVHRNRLHHILLNFLNAAKLVIGLGVIKSRLKILLPVVVLGECKSLCLSALCIKGNKLVSHILDSLLDPGTGLLPLV